MFRREGKYRHEPTDKDSRFERIGLFVLAIFLLQVKRATSVSNHTSKTDLPNVITNQSIHSFTDFLHLRDTPVNGGPQLSRNHSSNYVEDKRTQQPHVILSDRNFKEKSSSTLSNSEGTDNSLHMFEIHTNSSLASSSFNSTVITYALNSGARSNGVTHVFNNFTNPQINSSSSIKAKKRRNKARNENKLSSDTPSRVSERNNSVDIAKTVIRSKKGKRRKYNSTLFSGEGLQHRGPHHTERRLERPLSGNPVNINSTGNEFTTPQRPLGLSNKHPILRHGGEQVLFRFKRDDVLINNAQEPVQNQLSRKEKKGYVALLKHPKQRSIPVPNVPVRTGYPAKSVLRKADLTSNFKDLTQHRNIVSKVRYGQLPSRGPASSQYPYLALGTNQNGWRKSVSSNIEKPLASSKLPAGYRLQNANQFVQLMPSLSKRKNLQSDSVRPARILNAAGTAQSRIPSSTNFQNELGHGQASSKLSSTGLIRKKLISSSRNAFYSFGSQFSYPPQSLIPQLPFAHVNPQVLRYPQAPQRLLPSGPQVNSVARGLSPLLPQTSNHLINKGDFSALTPGGQQGLLMYLNFEDIASGKSPYAYYNGDLAGAEKRTKISSYFGSCGKIARINNGSEILLNGAKIKVKPRKAISIAAWIKVDTNRGYHSIFDTIGGHSLHKQGQYHFEIQDGSIRWFHRNESNVQIFSVETAPLIAANKWNHIVGTYDSHTGTAKVFVNGRLKAEAAGNGFLSQDWDAHAGIGKHKDARFLQGEVDEFRIYNKALTQKDINDLMKICNFQRACGGFFYSPTGTIESPEWPGHYKGKTHCTWRVSVDPGEKISLHFNSFKLEEDGSCDKAKLVARDGDNKDANVLGVYCGTKRPLEIATSRNHLWLQFTSMKGAEGKGFLLYYDTASSHLTKKTESPPLPFSDSQRCAVTLPKYNVTLVGGIKSGTFSEAKHVHDIDLCTRHCCLRRDCDLAFMIRDTCYLVKCANDLLCQTKRARPSNMNPRISFVSHLSSINLEPQISIDGTAESKWTTPGPTSKVASDVQPVCHHTAVSYNVTLVGGISAGKFSTYGTTKTIDQCIRHCCHDSKCDIAFMIQGNCYAVECADIEGCQVKRAKPSVYHPTVAYVYRGNGRPIGDPLPGAEKPSPDACSPFTVSNTVYNVTLQGGIKAGNFTDKGVVKNMDECAAFCCADEGCNVAFLIRDNCFTVACKGYDSCKMKPALSEYYHPRLAYVNWSPPDDEIPANRWYASLGCWKDTDSFAVATLEGSDPLLKGSLAEREKPIDTCAQVAGKHNYKVFAIQNGGACLGGPTAGRMFNQFGESSACKNGTGGLFVNDVYRLTDSGSYVSLGCWNDSIDHALPLLEHSDPILEDSYQSRPDPLLKCGQVARRKGFVIFAIQRGGMCFGGSRAEIDYRKFGISRKCHNGLGGSYANNVYRLIDNLGAKPTESTDNITVPPAGTSTTNADSSENTTPNTNPSGSSNPNTTPTGSSTSQTTPTGSSTPNTTPTGSATSALPSDVVGTQRSPTTSPSPSTYIEENYLTLQDDLPHRNTYTAGEILHNVTLKYGIKAGRFSDKGKVANMTDCVRACGKLETCSLAFMLGKQCFSVSCYNEALCGTKPAFSPFYKPKIAYVKHKKEPVTGAKPLADLSQCRTSIVHNDVTLVGGIHAGKFTDLGDAENMSICSERCCLKDTCDVAFMLEGECYGVSCVNESMCETRPARNPSRYNPKVAYIHHEKAKDKVSPRPKLQSLLSMMDRLLNDQPQKQTPVNFTPVNGTYADTTALSLDTDLSNDVGNHVSSDVSYQPNKLSSDQQMDRKNIGDTFLTDDSTPSTSAENYERLVNSVKDGQMNVYDIPYYFDDNEMQSKKFKSYLKSPPNKILKNMDGYYGTAQDSNSDLKTLNPVNQRIWTGISPGLDWTYNTELKDIEKFLQNDRNIRIGDGNEAKVASSYYDNNYHNILSKATGDRFSNYEKLHLGQTENTPQDVLSDSLSFDMQDNTHGSQTVNSDLSVSPLVSTQQKNPVCWDGQILYNYTLVGGINAGTFTDNGKTTNMDLCMQSCCKRESCDLAFMIEDDCYSVACNSNGACEPRKARPTHYNPRIAIRKKAQGDYHIKGFPTEPASSTQSTPSTPTSSPSSASSETSTASSPTPVSSVTQPYQDGFGNTPIKVTHSCDATPIEYNVTLKMGLHSGIFQKIGRVDTMDDCIEMSCTHEKSDVAFMLGSMCFAVSCYSDDLCKTVPIFGSSISRLNLNPAISFLRKKAHLRTESLGLQSEATEPDKCRDSTITYNVTLRGGIDAGNFTERGGILSMRDCIGKCCDDKTCDLAFMFGDSCYSVECKSEKLCQAVLAKPSRLEPKVSYVTRGYLEDKDKGTMFSVDDQTPTCRADQKSRSEVVSNKTLVGGLEAGKFSFVGVVSDMGMCMDRCCAQRDCNVAYMVDKNCFAISCYSPSLCKISDVSSTNGDVEISTIMNSTTEKPAEKHSMVVYVIIGVVGFIAGAGGILWAVCMFVRRHRLRSRHTQDTD